MYIRALYGFVYRGRFYFRGDWTNNYRNERPREQILSIFGRGSTSIRHCDKPVLSNRATTIIERECTSKIKKKLYFKNIVITCFNCKYSFNNISVKPLKKCYREQEFASNSSSTYLWFVLDLHNKYVSCKNGTFLKNAVNLATLHDAEFVSFFKKSLVGRLLSRCQIFDSPTR